MFSEPGTPISSMTWLPFGTNFSHFAAMLYPDWYSGCPT